MSTIKLPKIFKKLLWQDLSFYSNMLTAKMKKHNENNVVEKISRKMLSMTRKTKHVRFHKIHTYYNTWVAYFCLTFVSEVFRRTLGNFTVLQGWYFIIISDSLPPYWWISHFHNVCCTIPQLNEFFSFWSSWKKMTWTSHTDDRAMNDL